MPIFRHLNLTPSSHWQQVLCQAIRMAKKRTKADKLQRNVERLATRDEARRESQINDKRSEPISEIPDPTEREEQIRLRAYALYEARGRADGHDPDDWLQAEAEILGSKKTAIGHPAKSSRRLGSPSTLRRFAFASAQAFFISPKTGIRCAASRRLF